MLTYVFPHTEEHVKKYSGARGLIKDFKQGKYSEYLHSQIRGTEAESPFRIMLAHDGEIHGGFKVSSFRPPDPEELAEFPYARRVYILEDGSAEVYGKPITYEALFSLPSFAAAKNAYGRIRFAPRLWENEYEKLRKLKR